MSCSLVKIQVDSEFVCMFHVSAILFIVPILSVVPFSLSNAHHELWAGFGLDWIRTIANFVALRTVNLFKI